MEMAYRWFGWALALALAACSGDSGTEQGGQSGVGDGDFAGDGDLFGDGDGPWLDGGPGDGDGDQAGDGDAAGDGDRAGDPDDADAGQDDDCVREAVDALDLLFVVDDSQSMAQEQQSLREQFPRLIEMLASGRQDLPGNRIHRFEPASSIHLGVVSTDMGLVGIHGVTHCTGLGKDGVLQHQPSADPELACEQSYPQFLSFDEGDDIPALAQDFQCIATLGIEGCGFEQQLEAGLKAVWPALDIDPATGAQWIDPDTGNPGNRFTFIADSDGNGRFGHGDGQNAGFLRSHPNSIVGIVVVTDENDCSAHDTRIFTPGQFLPDSNPLKDHPINLRCFLNQDEYLYSVQRYINGFRALRPGHEDLVLFAAIAGVPVDLARLYAEDGQPLRDLDDPVAREQWYEDILGDPRMQETIDTSIAEVTKRNLVPSCGDGGADSRSLAYPPRRLVEVARGFGQNGVVQSICQDDFSGAIDALVSRLANRLGVYVCLE